MKVTIAILATVLLVACSKSSRNHQSIELINGLGRQDSIFSNLISIVNNAIPTATQQDSLAFLILPVQASCPSCRKKTIDSIMKHKDNLAKRHFVIIAANGGRKLINSYFIEQDDELPMIENGLFLDSTNLSYRHNLYKDKPTMYYTFNKRAYKKVAAIPATVKQDLQEFFSGYRNKE